MCNLFKSVFVTCVAQVTHVKFYSFNSYGLAPNGFFRKYILRTKVHLLFSLFCLVALKDDFYANIFDFSDISRHDARET